MKIGILETGLLNEAFVDQFDPYPVMFASLLDRAKQDFEYRTYSVVRGEMPESIDECDGWLITGSRFGAYEKLDWMEALEAFIRELHRGSMPLAGICFGHQIIALVRGGVVEKSDKGWGIGIASNEIAGNPSWMIKPPAGLNMLSSHQDQVTQLPGDTQIIAQSDFCPYFVVQWGDHFLSIQGHPEWSNAYSGTLMNDRRAIIPAERIEAGLKSLDQQADRALFVSWIMNFVEFNAHP